jgi:hypothetical protein
VVALVPMLRAGFATVIGEGSDAHLAVGTADFLQDNHPTAVDPGEPVDRIPQVWRSKQAIYYALGSVAWLSGLEVYEAITPVAALMLSLAAVGLFLMARELFGAGVLAGAAAMGVAGLDRMVLHTGMHPYFNQTWGYFTLPFGLLLSWWAVRHRGAGTIALLVLFLALGAFAYPLALPIPLVALAVFWWTDRRERRARGERVAELSMRRLYRGRRSLLWLVPVCLALAVPIFGVVEKTLEGISILNPARSLRYWGGDLFGFVPTHQFFSLPSPTLWWLAVGAMLAFAAVALVRRPRPLALGLVAVVAFGFLAAWYFRQRDFGWYLHFKILAFVAPLVVACAAVGAARLRRLGPFLVGTLLLSAHASARQEIDVTHPQLTREMIELRAWDRGLPRDASVRLDTDPPLQLWVAYMLSGQPLCSERPLTNTSYPHVPVSRSAEYVLAERRFPKPSDATGAPLRQNGQFSLYRVRAGLPGPNRCSRRMVQEPPSRWCGWLAPDGCGSAQSAVSAARSRSAVRSRS